MLIYSNMRSKQYFILIFCSLSIIYIDNIIQANNKSDSLFFCRLYYNSFAFYKIYVL